MTLRLAIDNMHCGACVRRVMGALNALPETHAEEVRVGSAQVRTKSSSQVIAEALAAAGYPARVEEPVR